MEDHPLQFTQMRRDEQVVVLTPRGDPPGELIDCPGTEELKHLIDQFDHERVKHVVVNLSNIRQVNSAGFTVLFGGLRKFEQRGAQFSICCANARIDQFIHFLGHGCLRTSLTEEKAIARGDSKS